MNLPKLMGIASGIALSSSLAFGWSISGVVSSDQGQPLGGVNIISFNYAGVSAVSNADGTFAISDDPTAIFGTKAANMSLHMDGNTLSIENIRANSLKISVINALGKVIKQRDLVQIYGSVSMDLGKLAKGAKFIRVTADSQSSTYLINGTGVTSLKKEGDPLPAITFTKEGYKNVAYQAKAEVETGVQIVMEAGASTPTSSSVVQPPQSSSVVASSSSVVASSSSQAPAPVDCSGKTAKPVDKQKMSVTVDGKQRTFIMHVPNTYKGDKPVPLVVDYHPVMGSGEGQYGGTTYRSQTDPDGVISLYPDGTKSADSRKMGPGWNVGPCCSDDDDVKFSREMIKAVEEIACIDKQRIYATGFSMGGGMSNHVACFMSDVFAAVAPAGMDLNTTNSAKCNPERPISVINFRGTNDGTCRYQGGDSGFNDGLNFLGAEGTFKFWAQKNGCEGSPSKNSNGCDEYSNCKDGVKVVLCTKQGGGHEQGDGKVGWPFLKQFTLPASFVK